MPSSFLMIRRPPRSTLFPYTTLFRSLLAVGSDYNLLLISRFKEEIHAGLKTGTIRAMAGSGSVVTAAGLVFATEPEPAIARIVPVLRDRKSTRLNSSHQIISYAVFFFNDPATTEIYTLSLHDALPISAGGRLGLQLAADIAVQGGNPRRAQDGDDPRDGRFGLGGDRRRTGVRHRARTGHRADRPRLERSEEHTSELQSPDHLVCRLLF